jgi:hypothetical protein
MSAITSLNQRRRLTSLSGRRCNLSDFASESRASASVKQVLACEAVNIS